MSSANPLSPGDDYFNDLSQAMPNPDGRSSGSPIELTQPASHHSAGDGVDGLPRPKRIACVICRKRKLKCDGMKPSCGTCARLGHDCAYDQERKKSGPKRGYVKALEARLAQVETLLKTHDPEDGEVNGSMVDDEPDARVRQHGSEKLDEAPRNVPGASTPSTSRPPQTFPVSSMPPPMDSVTIDAVLGGAETFTWEMIGMGIDEPLPAADVMDALTQMYFEKIHPSLPVIHRRRYLAAMNLAPHMRPPVCLRYAMWCLAASISDNYVELQEIFYHRARKYIEIDEMKGHGECQLTLAHAQCWSLIANYEFKSMYFPRSWMSTGRATRLSQMMGLHRLDGYGLDVKQCLSPPRDWTEREERRRTFWLAFCQDRYASIGTGWPMIVEEKDILTNLPGTEEAFEKSKPQKTMALSEAMSAAGATSLSPFAGVVLIASLFGRNLLHLHRPDENDAEDDLNGEFWKRHRQMDNILLNTSLSLPGHFRLPNGLTDANIVFLNMSIHTSTICLHQAAIFKADKNKLPANVSAESKVRCITAAAEIASIMRMISHVDPCLMNPFQSFCLYVAARVFVQYLKSRPADQQVRASLQFLLSAMQIMKRKNPLTESFLVQLDVDLEGTGLDDPSKNSSFAYSLKKGVGKAEIPVNTDSVHCSPLSEIRQSQNPVAPAYNFTPFASTGGGAGDGATAGQSAFNLPSPETMFDLPSRTKSAPTPPDKAPLKHPPMPGVFPSENYPSQSGGSPVGVDMDLSPEASTSSSSSADRPQHQHPSPAGTNTSHNGSSSHTSFTPPSYDDNQPSPQHHTAYVLQPTADHSFAGDTTATGFTPASFMPQTPGKDSDIPFVIPQGWDFDGTGMTPGTEGMFAQMMEVTWGDESGFGANNNPA